MFACLSHIRLIILAALVSAAWTLPAAAEPLTIRAGVSVNYEGMLPIYLAEEKGYFADANIALERLDFAGGGPTVQAFVGDGVDICFCSGDHVLRLRNRNIPAVFLYALKDQHGYTLIGREDLAGPGGLEGLEGKKLGITSPGSNTDNTLRWAIKELQLDPDSDFHLVGAGTGASMVASITTGQVNAGMLLAVDTRTLMNKGNYKIVEDFSQLPYVGYGAIFKESWISEHPAEAKGFVDAVNKAVSDLRSDPSLGIKFVREMYPSRSDEELKYLIEDSLRGLPENGRFVEAAVDNMNSIMLTINPDLRAVTVEEIMVQP